MKSVIVTIAVAVLAIALLLGAPLAFLGSVEDDAAAADAQYGVGQALDRADAVRADRVLCATVKAMAAKVPGATAHCN